MVGTGRVQQRFQTATEPIVKEIAVLDGREAALLGGQTGPAGLMAAFDAETSADTMVVLEEGRRGLLKALATACQKAAEKEKAAASAEASATETEAWMHKLVMAELEKVQNRIDRLFPATSGSSVRSTMPVWPPAPLAQSGASGPSLPGAGHVSGPQPHQVGGALMTGLSVTARVAAPAVAVAVPVAGAVAGAVTGGGMPNVDGSNSSGGERSVQPGVRVLAAMQATQVLLMELLVDTML